MTHLSDAFDLISYEVAKLRNLMSALELATDCLQAPADEDARRRRDATVGVVDVMRKQLDELDRVVEEQVHRSTASGMAA